LAPRPPATAEASLGTPNDRSTPATHVVGSHHADAWAPLNTILHDAFFLSPWGLAQRTQQQLHAFIAHLHQGFDSSSSLSGTSLSTESLQQTIASTLGHPPAPDDLVTLPPT
jgi:hypothetical protein